MRSRSPAVNCDMHAAVNLPDDRKGTCCISWKDRTRIAYSLGRGRRGPREGVGTLGSKRAKLSSTGPLKVFSENLRKTARSR